MIILGGGGEVGGGGGGGGGGSKLRNYCAQCNSLLLSILRGLYSGRWFEHHLYVYQVI